MKILWFSRHAFPSPRGDEFQLLHIMIWMLHDGFRPLTGINFNKGEGLRRFTGRPRFRPLTGINFNVSESVIASNFQRFPSPHGDKFQLGFCNPSLGHIKAKFPSPLGDKFQPIVYGWNFDVYELFPSPHGDKFQPNNTKEYIVNYVSVPSRG